MNTRQKYMQKDTYNTILSWSLIGHLWNSPTQREPVTLPVFFLQRNTQESDFISQSSTISPLKAFSVEGLSAALARQSEWTRPLTATACRDSHIIYLQSPLLSSINQAVHSYSNTTSPETEGGRGRDKKEEGGREREGEIGREGGREKENGRDKKEGARKRERKRWREKEHEGGGEKEGERERERA